MRTLMHRSLIACLFGCSLFLPAMSCGQDPGTPPAVPPVWTAEKASDWLTPFADWPGTRYEAKAIREGRRPTYLTFRRL